MQQRQWMRQRLAARQKIWTAGCYDALSAKMIEAAGVPVSKAVRKREALYSELELDGATDDQLLDAMAANPILIERPFVVTDKGVRLARPIESVDEII